MLVSQGTEVLTDIPSVVVSHWCVTNNPKISQLALIIYCAHKSQSGQSLTRTAQLCSTWHQSGWLHWAWKTHIQGGSQHSWRAETACQLGLSTEGLSSSQETRLREAWASFTAWELGSKNPGGSCKVSYDLALEAPECLFHHVPWGRQICIKSARIQGRGIKFHLSVRGRSLQPP